MYTEEVTHVESAVLEMTQNTLTEQKVAIYVGVGDVNSSFFMCFWL